MKVYVVWYVGYGAHTYMEGIFSTQEKAQIALNELHECERTAWIDEMEVL